MKSCDKKSYLVPEVVMLPLVPMGVILETSSEFGKKDGAPGAFSAPKKDNIF